MKREKLILGIVLFILGFLGILSLLTMDIQVPREMLEQFTAAQIRLIILLNPTILLIVAILVGVILHEKVSLELPVIKGIIRGEKNLPIKPIVQYGITGGIITGVLLLLTGALYSSLIPMEFAQLDEIPQPLLARLLYGGITEEILMRFGLMTLIVWTVSKISRRLDSWIYWAGILTSALLFAIGHFPIVFQTVENPSNILLSYIVIGNSAGGVIFGWLYWKRGLEAAIIAHMFAHLVMVIGEAVM
ncbi:hypothetical protein CHISP_3206 [Chitinispirillum alkaliphilum]|nr:hypothetical protein CHISP_3206 [Chitinispirillum alkaliphilum]